MENTSPSRPAATAALSTIGALRQALGRLADALDRPGPEGDRLHAAAFASVLNLAGDKFLDARADFIGNLVAHLSADARGERLFDAWVHFMDHFAGYVLQGEPTRAARYVYALAGVLEGVPAHHQVGRVESTEALARELSQAAFGQDGCVRIARDLQPPTAIEPDFLGFLQFYAVRQVPGASQPPLRADSGDDDGDGAVDFSVSEEDDARWAGLSPAQRAGEAAGREAVFAVCVQPPDGVEVDYAELLTRLCAWVDAQDKPFALRYAIDGVSYDATCSVVDLGAPFSTALAFRQFLVGRDVRGLVARAKDAAGGTLRAVVSLVAPPEELDEHSEEPLVRPSVALFETATGRFVDGLHLAAAAGDIDAQLAAVRQSLEDGGVTAVRFCATPRPDVEEGGQAVHYDEQGGRHTA